MSDANITGSIGPANIPLISGVTLIARERERQVKVEGYALEHDRAHTNDELAKAAVAYALPEAYRFSGGWPGHLPRFWPWAARFWRPTPHNRVWELTKAGALIAAEIDRLLELEQ